MNKTFLFILFLLSSLLLLLFSPHFSSSSPNLSSPLTIENHFHQWILIHGRNYTNQAEKGKRLQIFADNYRLVEEHNKKNLTYTLKLNKFADLTNDEFNCNEKINLSIVAFIFYLLCMRYFHYSTKHFL